MSAALLRAPDFRRQSNVFTYEFHINTSDTKVFATLLRTSGAQVVTPGMLEALFSGDANAYCPTSQITQARAEACLISSNRLARSAIIFAWEVPPRVPVP